MGRNLIKSYSNYVLRKKHQNTNSGNIYERDITTIGGLDKFARGQIPMYKSSNFVITFNNEIPEPKDSINEDFVEWNLSDVKNSNEFDNNNEEKIVIKQNYYKLRDFAYFGSCVELVRASLLNIIDLFPGEINMLEGYDDSGNTVSQEFEIIIDDDKIETYYVLNNPFNINLHTKELAEQEIDNPLKYMCNGGFKNYCDVTDDNNYGNPFTNFSVTEKFYINDKGEKVYYKCGIIADIKLGNHTIYAYKDWDNTKGEVIYLTKEFSLRIRPLESFYYDFFEKLDSFEKVLMNKNSEPKYTATFEVMTENSYGYSKEYVQFSFPLKNYKDNYYNLDIIGPAYEAYVNSLYNYAKNYDELFCDNLYRSMTHESIKNFDWSFKRRFTEDEETQYIDGGKKIEKVIRLFGREFDEIKLQIDSIKDFNNIEYGDSSLLPDYFLTDVLENDGWDVINVYPFNGTDENSKPIQVTKLFDSNNKEIFLTPYSKDYLTIDEKNGYFIVCKNCGSKGMKKESANLNERFKLDCSNTLRNRIKKYTSERKYTIEEANNHFLKMLKLNSKSILRKKGTIEGIESLLALFGLKSNRMCKTGDDVTAGKYDYKIIEYTSCTNKIDDKYEPNVKKPLIDWYNATKMVAYNTDSFRNGFYEPYQGLPVRCYVEKDNELVNIDTFINDSELYDFLQKKETDKQKVYIYPYFNYDKIIDGNPFYQLNGGWMKKSHQFTYKNNLKSYGDNSYTETYRNIRTVSTLDDLIELPLISLRNNDIYKVENPNEDYVIIDGYKYHIYSDTIVNDDNQTEKINPFIKLTVFNNLVKVGNRTFEDVVNISIKTNNDKKYESINLNYLKDNSELRVYILGNGNEDSPYKIIFSGKYYGISTPIINFSTTEPQTIEPKFYQLKNRFNKTKINNNGWVELENDSDEIKRLETIVTKKTGNNPHTGNLNYDSGYEYMSYFITLFKHSIDNNLFNENCLNDDDLDKIKNVGFDGIDNELIKNDYIIYNDEKIHNFTERKPLINGNIKTRQFNNDYNISPFNEKTIQSAITDEIINTKRVDIIFNKDVKNKIYEIKYLDYVIMNYLEQVYPSSLITHTYYNNNDGKYDYQEFDCKKLQIDGNIPACGTNNVLKDLKITYNYGDEGEEEFKPFNNIKVIPSVFQPNETDNTIEHTLTFIIGNNECTTEKSQEKCESNKPTDNITYDLSIECNDNIKPCDEEIDVIVYKWSYVNGIGNKEIAEEDNDYIIDINPLVNKNESNDTKTYTVTVTGKGDKYEKCNISHTVSQNGNGRPCGQVVKKPICDWTSRVTLEKCETYTKEDIKNKISVIGSKEYDCEERNKIEIDKSLYDITLYLGDGKTIIENGKISVNNSNETKIFKYKISLKSNAPYIYDDGSKEMIGDITQTGDGDPCIDDAITYKLMMKCDNIKTIPSSGCTNNELKEILKDIVVYEQKYKNNSPAAEPIIITDQNKYTLKIFDGNVEKTDIPANDNESKKSFTVKVIPPEDTEKYDACNDNDDTCNDKCCKCTIKQEGKAIPSCVVTDIILKIDGNELSSGCTENVEGIKTYCYEISEDSKNVKVDIVSENECKLLYKVDELVSCTSVETEFTIEKNNISDKGTTYTFISCYNENIKCNLVVTKKEEIVPECKCIINDINLIAINNKDNLAVIEENGIKTYTYSFKEETNEEDFKISLIFDKNNKCDNCEENTQVEKISTEPTITGHSVSVICGDSFPYNGSPSYTATTKDLWSNGRETDGEAASVTWNPKGNNTEETDRKVTVTATYQGKSDFCTTTQEHKIEHCDLNSLELTSDGWSGSSSKIFKPNITYRETIKHGSGSIGWVRLFNVMNYNITCTDNKLCKELDFELDDGGLNLKYDIDLNTIRVYLTNFKEPHTLRFTFIPKCGYEFKSKKIIIIVNLINISK